MQQDVGILGNSETIRQLIETIDQVARTDISILITGESGTGKELVAKALHQRSKRRNEPLITVNSGAIPEGILESELFGHEKGSFTGAVGPRKGYFELADKGSIFLDEIGDLPLTIQVKLLRVLEGREFMRVGGTAAHQVDVRFITATNKNLEEEVRRGQFRQDLYYRLNAMHIRVPGLRERKEDIPLLVKKFAADFSRENHIEFNGFDDSALFALQQYSWPGNIRELRNTVEKAIVMERGQRITEMVLKKYIQSTDQRSHALPVPINKPKDEIEREFLLRLLLEIKSEISQLRELVLSGVRIPYRLGPWREEFPAEYAEQISIEDSEEQKQGRSIAEVERELIIDTLMRTGGNKRKTAEILGMSERTLYRKINRYGLRRGRS
ncbi:sigma-54-dependent Fis family transcriptional regulator [candidate division KSB1 bacterium RBG_16_48_16]|nr:MAG: sigma-54-dependent Fis family transcriptional regulator [candidate division KSB1 bacterium RBG_16_48_16]